MILFVPTFLLGVSTRDTIDSIGGNLKILCYEIVLRYSYTIIVEMSIFIYDYRRNVNIHIQLS